jgi:hypothetical protein
MAAVVVASVAEAGQEYGWSITAADGRPGFTEALERLAAAQAGQTLSPISASFITSQCCQGGRQASSG